jgi:hypothetical protein
MLKRRKLKKKRKKERKEKECLKSSREKWMLNLKNFKNKSNHLL